MTMACSASSPILLARRLALFIVGMFFARLYRRLKLLTFVDIVDQRYGKTAGAITTATTLISNIGWVGAMLVAFGLVFESLTGTPLEIGIIVGATVIILVHDDRRHVGGCTD